MLTGYKHPTVGVTFPQDYPESLQSWGVAPHCSFHLSMTLPLRFNLETYKGTAAMSSTNSAAFKVLAAAHRVYYMQNSGH